MCSPNQFRQHWNWAKRTRRMPFIGKKDFYLPIYPNYYSIFFLIFSYSLFSDIRSIDSFSNQTLIAVKAPLEPQPRSSIEALSCIREPFNFFLFRFRTLVKPGFVFKFIFYFSIIFLAIWNDGSQWERRTPSGVPLPRFGWIQCYGVRSG